MKFSVFQMSRRGGRPLNEDRMGYCYTRDSGLFLVADGMGGHPEGEVAAHIALQVICSAYQQAAKTQISDPSDFLTNALLAAHEKILRYANEHGMTDTPRTTVVAALLQGNEATWVHCGDSRLYLVRDGELLVRTRDHSYMEQRHDKVIIAKPGEKINRNILFTCLGSPVEPVFDVSDAVTLQQGDKLLLCSDGLWGSLTDVEIVHDLALNPVSKSVPGLVDKALLKAGARSDNVTVIALEWETPADNAAGGISTDSLSAGVFTSTMQDDGPAGAEVDDLDDEAIERSIAEIKEAIRRTATRKR